jgi:tetratricopeptide (TPR) repeat protein
LASEAQKHTDVWYDEHNLGSGQLIDTIQRELKLRPVFVLILSPAALRSPWVRNEAKWAFTLLMRDPSRIFIPVTAAALTADEMDEWLFIEDFKRIEAPGLRPFPTPEAAQRLLRALALTPRGAVPAPTAPQPQESADDLIARGKALQAQGKHADALPLFQRATHLAPKSFSAWFNLGYTLNMLKRWQDALAAYEQALVLNPNDADAGYNKGTTLSDLGRTAEALAAYEQALALDPKDAMCWRNKSSTLADLQRYTEALAAAETALQIEPNNAIGWDRKARALRGLGRTAEAETAEARAKTLRG